MPGAQPSRREIPRPEVTTEGITARSATEPDRTTMDSTATTCPSASTMRVATESARGQGTAGVGEQHLSRRRTMQRQPPAYL
jgi:hypothetical protein